ncbi:50S ribosomal protein L21 [Rhodobacteraceae bacterium 2CG4]|uniref:Large ribosomal subunit protein bL21 n=1 Tax=Halovulum marinum TaxID=2662447 RepID=A0A6L5Z0E5_9RHOB|nr:50S ribosomal protein L21 [Halovulum marinum]MSU90036.1 50S ribosomal protein L21 [Halovulum marinum]
MFAVLRTGGKQYKVAKDDKVSIEKLNAQPGETVQFNDILMLGGDKVTVGAPFITGAAVQAEVVDQFRGPKTISYKKRRRKASSQRRKGHRQSLTLIRVTDILASGGDKTGVRAADAAAETVSEAPAKAAKPAAKKAAPKPSAKPAAKAEAKAAPKAAGKAGKADAPAADAGSKPANLLAEARGKADDLKKIGGVGPKLEKTLNEAGVFHFWQIAEWGPEEVAHMDELLSFKGRIERDDWIGQAKTFAAETE